MLCLYLLYYISRQTNCFWVVSTADMLVILLFAALTSAELAVVSLNLFDLDDTPASPNYRAAGQGASGLRQQGMSESKPRASLDPAILFVNKSPNTLLWSDFRSNTLLQSTPPRHE